MALSCDATDCFVHDEGDDQAGGVSKKKRAADSGSLPLGAIGWSTRQYCRVSLHLHDEDGARFLTEEGLKLDGKNEHLKRLAEKFPLL